MGNFTATIRYKLKIHHALPAIAHRLLSGHEGQLSG
jgi:hypothetical protein